MVAPLKHQISRISIRSLSYSYLIASWEAEGNSCVLLANDTIPNSWGHFLSLIYHLILTCSPCVSGYEARTLLVLGVSWCRTSVGVRRHDTYDYTELCHFLKLLSVSCPVSVSMCFIGLWTGSNSNCKMCLLPSSSTPLNMLMRQPSAQGTA